jgi:hypothetical protein
LAINLILVIPPTTPSYVANMKRVAARVRGIDKNISTYLVPVGRGFHAQLLRLYFQPTLSLSIQQPHARMLLPGRVITGAYTDKCSQSTRMDAAGIPVPKWTVITPETRLDPATWGPYVVEKPAAGKWGAFVRIRKTGRVRYAPPESFPADHYGRNGPMIAQRFVYTGERPTSYRAVTFFGETLLCYRQWSMRGYPLRSRWDFKSTGGSPIVSNVKGMQIALDKDNEVIALAERTHREAFAEFPLLTIDIVRDADSGELFVLEAHTRGHGWLFSRPVDLSIQADNSIDFESQFDGIEKSAQILARETPRLAAVSWPLRRSATPSDSQVVRRERGRDIDGRVGSTMTIF